MFRSANLGALVKFNSAASSELISLYENHISNKISEGRTEPSERYLAPSGLRCDRKGWFRLRGTVPDKIVDPDTTLDFLADMGTACHRVIQSNLKEILKDDWIEVDDYLREFNPTRQFTSERSGMETLIRTENPPVKFACDGIIRLKGKYYLLEIKTADHSSFRDLTDPKDEHMDQIKAYASLLNISNVLVLYQDRQYGDIKCYERFIDIPEMEEVLSHMKYIQDMAKNNLAPDRLSHNDYMCSNCEYAKKCREWG